MRHAKGADKEVPEIDLFEGDSAGVGKEGGFWGGQGAFVPESSFIPCWNNALNG